MLSDEHNEEDDTRSPEYRDAEIYIPYIVSNFNWTLSTEATRTVQILDYGSGNGYKTKNILVPYIQHWFESTKTQSSFHISAFDHSEAFTDLAGLHNSLPEITYLAETEFNDVPQNHFDKIVSFRVLHYVKELENALKSLGGKLKPDGEIGLYFPAKFPMHVVMDSLSKEPAWASYHSNLSSILSPVFYSDNPETFMQDIMEGVGFEVQESAIKTRDLIFLDFDNMIDEFLSVSPYTKKIPETERDSYKKCVVKLFGPLITSVRTKAYPRAVQTSYTLLVVRARKCL